MSSTMTATPPMSPYSFSSCSLNFPRGKGPLKNSSDVINAAKKIAEAGSRMDKLARAVADQVALRLHFCLSLSFLSLHILSVWQCLWLCHSSWRRSEFSVKVSGPLEIFNVGIDKLSSGMCCCMASSPNGANTERERQQNQVVSLI